MEWHILKAFFSQVSVLRFSKTSKNPEDVILEKKQKQLVLRMLDPCRTDMVKTILEPTQQNCKIETP